jgi:hypothetical protein
LVLNNLTVTACDSGEDRDMQLIALEQLCMLLLMSDNVDRYGFYLINFL